MRYPYRAGLLDRTLGLTLSARSLACGPSGSRSVSESAGNASSDPPTPITRDVDALFQTDSLEYTLRAGEGGFEGESGVSIRVLAGYAGTNSLPQFSITDIPGEYRAVWGSVTSSYRNDAPPDKSVLPLEQRVSNRFMLATERR